MTQVSYVAPGPLVFIKVYRGTYNGYNIIVDKFKDHGLVKVIWGHLKEFADSRLSHFQLQ